MSALVILLLFALLIAAVAYGPIWLSWWAVCACCGEPWAVRRAKWLCAGAIIILITLITQ